ncbi:hypothetical protein EPN44_07430 [bacterium]|nr:MAG: hypothetical protein EPN44_07430 [bacterium]
MRRSSFVAAIALPVVLAFANPVGAQQSLEVPPVATPAPSAAPRAAQTQPPRGYSGGEASPNVPKKDRTSNLPTRVWEGAVVHASAQSVRVHSPAQHRDLTFLVFSPPHHLTDANGMGTYAMSELPPGTRVKVVYTQMLGVRHAYVIYIYRADGTIKKMHG